MKRRTVLGGIGVVGAIALLGGGRAELAAANAQLTGHLIKPRALHLSNQTDTTQTVSLTVNQEDGTTVFSAERTIAAETDVDRLWETTRIGRYTVTAQTPEGRQTSGDMLVCVGYHDAELLIEPEDFLIGQAHGDPDAGACSLDTGQ